jgi:hypothetical protein
MDNINLNEKEIDIEIGKIFSNNKLKDLKRFLAKREYLNKCNSYMVYFFYITQSAGLLTTTIATGYNMKELIWLGIGLNVISSLINIFEKTNNSISLKILKDISKIRDNTYIDEGLEIEPDENENNNKINLLKKKEKKNKEEDLIIKDIDV